MHGAVVCCGWGFWKRRSRSSAARGRLASPVWKRKPQYALHISTPSSLEPAIQLPSRHSRLCSPRSSPTALPFALLTLSHRNRHPPGVARGAALIRRPASLTGKLAIQHAKNLDYFFSVKPRENGCRIVARTDSASWYVDLPPPNCSVAFLMGREELTMSRASRTSFTHLHSLFHSSSIFADILITFPCARDTRRLC